MKEYNGPLVTIVACNAAGGFRPDYESMLHSGLDKCSGFSATKPTLSSLGMALIAVAPFSSQWFGSRCPWMLLHCRAFCSAIIMALNRSEIKLSSLCLRDAISVALHMGECVDLRVSWSPVKLRRQRTCHAIRRDCRGGYMAEKARKAYQELRDGIEALGGKMWYEQAGRPRGGVWIVRLGDKEKV